MGLEYIGLLLQSSLIQQMLQIWEIKKKLINRKNKKKFIDIHFWSCYSEILKIAILKICCLAI
jgi:hypothetical protein